jgi:hypothetical protein
VFGLYFLMDQGVVRLTLRIFGLVKIILLKTLLFAFMEKIKKVCFYRDITIGLINMKRSNLPLIGLNNTKSNNNIMKRSRASTIS